MFCDETHFRKGGWEKSVVGVGELINKTHKKHTILFLQQHSSPITTLIFHSLHLRDFVTSLDA